MTFHQKKILLVDDDKDLANIMSIVLRDHGYEVDISYDGQNVFNKLQLNPDIIILDRNLPDMEGLDICRQIREDKQYGSIPIIIISGMSASSDKIEGLYIGADDYLTKPFECEELVARLEAITRRIRFNEQISHDKDRLIGELKEIIEHKFITPYFQPIFSLKNNEVIGYEALCRPSLEGGAITNPELMFKFALSMGMYFDLEMMCWAKAFEKWKQFGSKTKLFLNCSPYLIESGRFDKELLLKHGVDLNTIVLELTERIAIQDYASFIARLAKIRSEGLSIAVDDVGCGFASLNTVAEVKPDYLKIDMPLIRGIDTDPLKQHIIQSIVDFSKKTRMVVVAEGIEVEAELQKIIELGVDAGEGYLLGRPSVEIRA